MNNELINGSRSLEKWRESCRLRGIANKSTHRVIRLIVDKWLTIKGVTELHKIDDDTYAKMCYCAVEPLLNEWGFYKETENSDVIKELIKASFDKLNNEFDHVLVFNRRTSV